MFAGVKEEWILIYYSYSQVIEVKLNMFSF